MSLQQTLFNNPNQSGYVRIEDLSAKYLHLTKENSQQYDVLKHLCKGNSTSSLHCFNEWTYTDCAGIIHKLRGKGISISQKTCSNSDKSKSWELYWLSEFDYKFKGGGK